MADESISTAYWISMKSRHSGLKRFRRVQMVLADAVIFVSCGCAHLATVRTTQPRIPTIAAENAQLGDATEYLVRAERAQPLVALGDDLSAAQLSLNMLEQRPSDSSAQSIYNFSVARAVEDVERAKIQPWRHPINIGTDEGKYVFSSLWKTFFDTGQVPPRNEREFVWQEHRGLVMVRGRGFEPLTPTVSR